MRHKWLVSMAQLSKPGFYIWIKVHATGKITLQNSTAVPGFRKAILPTDKRCVHNLRKQSCRTLGNLWGSTAHVLVWKWWITRFKYSATEDSLYSVILLLKAHKFFIKYINTWYIYPDFQKITFLHSWKWTS